MNEENIEKKIVPQSVSGFPEWLPEEKIVENAMLDIIRREYELSGFVPIETPAVERQSVLIAKGGDEKEIYALHRLVAQNAPGEIDASDMALHFDLTVPLARYVSQHYASLTFPFRRYQIQKVWRGERPQAGRFREFYQCDIDVIGEESLDLMTDAEIPSIIYRIFSKLSIGDFVIQMSNRKILTGLLQGLVVPEQHHAEILRIIDKKEKIGEVKMAMELQEKTGLSEQVLTEIQKFLALSGADTMNHTELFHKLRNFGIQNEFFAQGINELEKVFMGVVSLGVPEKHLAINLSVVRGLEYYTGTVYETLLLDHPSLGSICSGGRYENLTGNFIEKKLPGVGISIGLSRLFSRLLQEKKISCEKSTTASVLVTTLDDAYMHSYLRIASALRDAGIATEVYFEPKKFIKQMKYANKKGFEIAIIAGENEFSQDNVVIKNLRTGEQLTVSLDNVVDSVQQQLTALQEEE